MNNHLQLHRILLISIVISFCLLPIVGKLKADNTACLVVDGVMVCEGDQAEGVVFSPPPTDLSVINLTADITPADGVSGIEIRSASGHSLGVNFDGSRGILTSGENAYGINVQSVGAIIDHPDDNANGGVVSVNNKGDLTTDGLSAHGIFALSRHGEYSPPIANLNFIWGNGGTINLTNSGEITILEKPVLTSLAHGLHALSEGAHSGVGGDIEIVNTGNINMLHQSHVGIFAQSQGGDSSGEGGDVSVTSYGDIRNGEVGGRSCFSFLCFPVDYSAISARSGGGDGRNAGDGGWFSDGNDGGDGGQGGDVRVHGGGSITSVGDYSLGIFAISQAGDGGDGGDGGDVGGDAGDGGIGGDGGLVVVEGAWSILTDGKDSHGIAARSMGGTGGESGDGGWLWGDGGSGGKSGDGGAVTVNYLFGLNEIANSIDTTGDDSHGIFAQSVGGFAGNGGDDGWLSSSAGDGGSAGVGGAVSITNNGIVSTAGERSNALFAESVGGGGGSSGDSDGLFSGGDAQSKAGGNGGHVTVVNNNLLQTAGAISRTIFAQSVGGGGGNAGSSEGWFSIGGTGGQGGDGNTVEVTNDGQLLTSGFNSSGIFAQSVGGGGGSGGNSSAVGLFGSVSIGGSGGGGGSGGHVHVVSNDEKINTSGDLSTGITAQSVGEGGGKGGFAFAGAVGPEVSVSVSVGGDGGGGGDGGTVDVESASAITTQGADAHGIFAQSVGGTGGDGGFSMTVSGSDKFAAAFSVGGGGGVGGDGDTVTVANDGIINTSGSGAVSLFAQSVGGGGGNGGCAFSGAIGSALTLTVAVGGSGGDGGAGSDVRVDNGGEMTTAGDFAHAIFAYSVGGGGGAGGMSITAGLGLFSPNNPKSANIGVSVGGKGGNGGNGGDVTVGFNDSVTGVLKTAGDDAHGIFAQSVGGGGGEGGSSLAITFSNDKQLKKENTSLSATFAFGGEGGKGNIGGNVQVDNRSEIGTIGDNSHGILAQSIGGGGGSGGGANAIALSTSDLLVFGDSEGKNWGFDLSAGGDGGDGNKGGTVSVVNHGSITTDGVRSRGILAQSVGGGGGSVAGSVLGEAGDWVDGAENILDALGVVKALVDTFKGDPGGLVPDSLSITVGGSGGSNADADQVSVDNRGDITTRGLEAHAIFAQSIGGGGGEAQAYAKGKGDGEDVDVGVGLLGEFVLGGAGGGAGDGSIVDISHSGTIITWGEAAYGIYAQSIGGGGGQSGSIAGGFTGLDSIGLGVAFGRDGGSGGNGELVSVVSSGDITTHAVNAVGVFAQSIGGGGGILGDVSGIAFAGSVGGYGSGGAVDVTHTGKIVTLGDAAHGILAQSSGGFHGQLEHEIWSEFTLPIWPNPESCAANPFCEIVIDEFNGYGGTVDVSLTGDIVSQGVDSVGILAQSHGGADVIGGGMDGGDNIAIIINSGFVQGGSASGVGVKFLDGKENTLVNRGIISALSGNAISGSGGNEIIDNYGTVTGNVTLGAGNNDFNNHLGAKFNSGATIELGVNRLLNNSGVMSPGGVGTSQVTALSGEYSQSESGALAIDVDLQHDIGDRLEVSNSAQLEGTLEVSNVNRGRANPGRHQQIILSASEGITNDSLNLVTPSSAVVTYSLTQLNQNELAINSRVNFCPSDNPFLSPNTRSVGDHINSIQAAGGSESFAPIAAVLVEVPDNKSLNSAYKHLIPEALGNLSTETAVGSTAFNNALHSCRQRNGEHRFVREGECRWFRADLTRRDQNNTTSAIGYNFDTVTLAGGIQKEMAAYTHFGYGLSLQSLDLESSLTESNGQQIEVGLIVKRQRKGSMLSGSFSAGYGWYETNRIVDLPTPGIIANSEQDILFASAHGRISHDFQPGTNRYLRPLLDLGISRIYRKSFTETGASGANLEVRGEHEWYATLQPGIEFGGEIKLANETLLRPYTRVGLTHLLTDTKHEVTASLQGAPNNIVPFTIETKSDRTYVDLTLGIDLIDKNAINVRFDCTGQYSSNSSSYLTAIKFAIPF